MSEPGNGWIGVDLDGTLAYYDGWNGGEIGAPIAPMVARVKAWLDAGIEVRIVTARVAPASCRDSNDMRAQDQRIRDWCAEHIGQGLTTTASKDFNLIELWDDRAVSVQKNTGKAVRATAQGIVEVPA